MNLVNCTIVSRGTSRIILRWTVMPLEPPGYTVLGFYKDKLQLQVIMKCEEGPSGSQE